MTSNLHRPNGQVGEDYTCSACRGVFKRVVSDEEALEEATAIWDRETAEQGDIVCDDCWNAMRQRYPVMDAELRRAGL